ncbi:MAG: hypothetical protein J3K34DRAFT_422337 [Monoraphidium minutum]|nr:MAG: hypothetical protein J3K34DRAFT_422337 [Monoraphidium minutum]
MDCGCCMLPPSPCWLLLLPPLLLPPYCGGRPQRQDALRDARPLSVVVCVQVGGAERAVRRQEALDRGEEAAHVVLPLADQPGGPGLHVVLQ